MKITDKQLRECAKGGHWCGSENRPEMARQLLAARKALRKIKREPWQFFPAQREAMTALICAALRQDTGRSVKP